MRLKTNLGFVFQAPQILFPLHLSDCDVSQALPVFAVTTTRTVSIKDFLSRRQACTTNNFFHKEKIECNTTTEVSWYRGYWALRYIVLSAMYSKITSFCLVILVRTWLDSLRPTWELPCLQMILRCVLYFSMFDNCSWLFCICSNQKQ